MPLRSLIRVKDVYKRQGRIAAEVVIFSDKICTDEEVVRLKSHIKHMKETLEQTEGIGRKLEDVYKRQESDWCVERKRLASG